MDLYAKLIREESDEQGTYGVLHILDQKWHTLELPWMENRNNVSCIPEGIYRVKWSLSPRLKRYTYEILDVPKRAGIRIHSGNIAGSPPFISHSLGCPLLGYTRGKIGKQKAILNSKKAVRDFERLLQGQPFLLEIKNA